MFPFRLRVIAKAAFFLAGTAQVATAQAVPHKDQMYILTNARSQYYNLRSAGLKSFACNINLDWDTIFTSIAGKTLPADNPRMIYLRKSRITLSADTSGVSEISWTNEDPMPEGMEHGVSQIRSGLKQAVGGFFTSWAPFINGNLISLSPKSLTQTPTGYLLDDSTKTNSDLVTMDKKFLVTHISDTAAGMDLEVDPTFASTEDGLVVTGLDESIKQSTEAPPMHILVSMTLQQVEKFQLPESLVIAIPNVTNFKMRFVGCTVQHQPN